MKRLVFSILATTLAFSIVSAQESQQNQQQAQQQQGQSDQQASGPRGVNPADVIVPPGYKVEVVAQGLDYPGDITFGRSVAKV